MNYSSKIKVDEYAPAGDDLAPFIHGGVGLVFENRTDVVSKNSGSKNPGWSPRRQQSNLVLRIRGAYWRYERGGTSWASCSQQSRCLHVVMVSMG